MAELALSLILVSTSLRTTQFQAAALAVDCYIWHAYICPLPFPNSHISCRHARAAPAPRSAARWYDSLWPCTLNPFPFTARAAPLCPSLPPPTHTTHARTTCTPHHHPCGPPQPRFHCLTTPTLSLAALTWPHPQRPLQSLTSSCRHPWRRMPAAWRRAGRSHAEHRWRMGGWGAAASAAEASPWARAPAPARA